VSLLGRLEDLSLTDIVQIVFLSRRTGILEIVDSRGRHTVLFRQGLVINGSSPEHPDLVTYLAARGLIAPGDVALIRKMEDNGVPCGTAAVDLNLVTNEALAAAIRERILSVVTPLLNTREGEFNFLLSESMSPIDVEFEVSAVFKDGGFPPQKIIGAAEGEKLKPLQGLEQSIKVGRALTRDGPPPQKTQFRVAGGLVEVENPEASLRNVVLFERSPMLRVAAKRAFSNAKVKISQFGSLEDTRAAMTDLFRSNSFFVSFLELTADDATLRLLQHIKARNARLPVVVIDSEVHLRRRHDVLRAGADLYVTKPGPERLQPGLAEEELALFSDELVLFAQRAFQQWEELTGTLGSDAGKWFYETAGQESVDRSFGVLKQLINELSDPNDISQVATTILRLSSQYLDRGALFVADPEEFAGVGGFGITGGGEEMNARIQSLRISRREPSILGEVAESQQSHRGKIRRTPANEQLIDRMGGLLPTEVVALPIMQNERAVGILYGDNAENRAPIDSMAGLEIFLSQAGFAFGNAVFASTGRGREGV
jgi:CheY-like chemotaxis protein